MSLQVRLSRELYGYRRKREAAFVERERCMERIERKEYRILVAVSSPRTMPSLMEAATAIARKRHGEIVAVTVAEGQSLMSGRGLARSLEPLLEAAVSYGEERGTRVRPVLTRTHPRSIVERVLHDAPCHVGIVYGHLQAEEIEGIVVPVTERANPRLAAELAPAFAERFSASTRAVTVVEQGMSPEEAARHTAEATATPGPSPGPAGTP